MNRFLNIKVILLILIMLPFYSFSQESDLGNWLIYIGNKKINEKFNLHHEVQYRNYNVAGDLEQLLLRTGIGYNLTENNNNLLLGYGFIRSENYVAGDDKIIVNEHRIFQQFITKHKIAKVNLQHRYRFEQRWVEENYKARFRYFLGLSVPLKLNEKESPFYLSGYNEIFLNTKNIVLDRNIIFDRNRVYGGLGYKINKNLRAELGYMNQYFSVNGRDQINILLFSKF